MGSLASSMPVSDSTVSACDLGFEDSHSRVHEQRPPCIPAPIDLMEAHRATHALNGALLDLSAAGMRLSLGDAPVGEEAEIWTATLRSDIDGPGGAYALIAPASMVWEMPPWRPSNGSPAMNVISVAQQTLAAVAEVGLSIAVRTTRDEIVVLATPEIVGKGQAMVELARGEVLDAPVALRLS